MDTCTVFDRVDKLTWNMECAALKEFIEDISYTYPGILSQLSHLYVLVAIYSFPQEHLREEQRALLEKNGEYVLGYIWLHPIANTSSNVRLIQFIDTRMRGIQAASYMMQKFQRVTGKVLLPHTIVYTAKGFWKKYFETVLQITTLDGVLNIIAKYGLNDYDCDWSKLIE